jgi:hypothetical protein
MKRFLKSILLKMPILGKKLEHYYWLSDKVDEFELNKGAFDLGHYYSPIPELSEIQQRKEEIFKIPESIIDIDLNIDRQLELLEKIRGHVSKLPYDLVKLRKKESYEGISLTHEI